MDWNREHRGMGQKNIPLNKHGFEQAQAAANVLSKEIISRICYSPLDRAKVTAAIIAEKTNSKLIEIPELMECCWGER